MVTLKSNTMGQLTAVPTKNEVSDWEAASGDSLMSNYYSSIYYCFGNVGSNEAFVSSIHNTNIRELYNSDEKVPVVLLL